MKPILFNTEAVRATLKGEKTTHLQVIKPQPKAGSFVCLERNGSSPQRFCMGYIRVKAPYLPGDILYVREPWGCYERYWWEANYFLYQADYPIGAAFYDFAGMTCDLPKWRPATNMPQDAARLFLRVKDIRVELLQEAAKAQAEASGRSLDELSREWDIHTKPKDYATCGWAANPWVWVIEFEQISKEEAEASD